MKDAVRSQTPGNWGTEVCVGEGDVDWRGFFELVRARNLDCDLLIEREAGGQRVADIQRAKALVLSHYEVNA